MDETPIEAPQTGDSGNGDGLLAVRKRGAQPGNRNRLRHGLKSGKMPREMKYLEPRINRLRVSLENAIVDIRGEVTTAEAGIIQTAMRWEAHACKAHHWLRVEYDELKTLEKLHCSREIALASAARDKAIKELGIDQRTVQDNNIESLYTEPVTLIDNRGKKQ